jgi:signal transduction histidine kinase
MTDSPLRTLLIGSGPCETQKLADCLGAAAGRIVKISRVNSLSDGLHTLAEGGIELVLLDLTAPSLAGAESVERIFSGELSNYHAGLNAVIRSAAERFLQAPTVDEAFQDVFGRLGRTMRANRISLFENDMGTGREQYTTLRYEWTSADVFRRLGDPAYQGLGLRAAGYESWIETLQRNEPLHGHVRADKLAGSTAGLLTKGLRSVIAAPVFVGADWWGFMVFDDLDHERTWSSAELEAVRTLAGMLGSLIQRKQAEQAERRLMQVKDDFVASVSHELRTPLYAIAGFIELLQKGRVKDPEVRQEFLDRVAQNTERLTGLVNDLLDVSRLEGGRLHLDLAEVELFGLVRETLRSLESLATSKHMTLHVLAGKSDARLRVSIDPSRIRQVIVNLVANAIKFSSEGTAVEVQAATEGDYVRVEVVDHGRGISRDDVPLIFTKFYRTESSVDDAVAGTGMGLYISRMIVETHGGRVGVESELGKGSVFFFTLPLSQQEMIGGEEPA